jgi:hypothetical protein
MLIALAVVALLILAVMVAGLCRASALGDKMRTDATEEERQKVGLV